MIRILIFSDTHGRRTDMEEIISQHPEAEYVIHLGDCVSDVRNISEFFSVRLYNVRGNCDPLSSADDDGEIVLGGKRIFFTHGHKYSVKSGTDGIVAEAKRRCANAVLFGHTHRAVCTYDNGLYIFNPGSLSRPSEGRPSYGIMDIVNGQIMPNIVGR